MARPETGSPTSFLKDPDATLDYYCDWTKWLAVGETISASTWSTTPTGLTVGSDDNAAGKTSIWLSGGTSGSVYTVTNRITTSGGKTDDLSFALTVAD